MKLFLIFQFTYAKIKVPIKSEVENFGLNFFATIFSWVRTMRTGTETATATEAGKLA
jgi:hypothetical protein